MPPVLDTTTAFGREADRRLHADLLAWLVTVGPDGTPGPVPVWFAWDGATVLVYTRPGTRKLRAIAANARVALHLDAGLISGGVVIVNGIARVSAEEVPPDGNEAYIARYRAGMAANGWTPEAYAALFSVALRIEPTRIHGW